jgi:hypothetical protein
LQCEAPGSRAQRSDSTAFCNQLCNVPGVWIPRYLTHSTLLALNLYSALLFFCRLVVLYLLYLLPSSSDNLLLSQPSFPTSSPNPQPHPVAPYNLSTMADDTGVTEDTSITFTVKSSTDAKFTLTLPISTPVSELKQKLSSSEYADTPADRQRLIYSGRVLKDNETLESYKIKDGHTIHLVKSAASNQQRTNPTGQASSTTAPAGATPSQPATGVPTNLAAGTGNNPLAGLTGARYAGFAQLPGAGLFGPDGGVSKP